MDTKYQHANIELFILSPGLSMVGTPQPSIGFTCLLTSTGQLEPVFRGVLTVVRFFRQDVCKGTEDAAATSLASEMTLTTTEMNATPDSEGSYVQRKISTVQCGESAGKSAWEYRRMGADAARLLRSVHVPS